MPEYNRITEEILVDLADKFFMSRRMLTLANWYEKVGQPIPDWMFQRGWFATYMCHTTMTQLNDNRLAIAKADNKALVASRKEEQQYG